MDRYLGQREPVTGKFDLEGDGPPRHAVAQGAAVDFPGQGAQNDPHFPGVGQIGVESRFAAHPLVPLLSWEKEHILL